MARAIVLLVSILMALALFAGCYGTTVPIKDGRDGAHWIKALPEQIAKARKATSPKISASTYYAAGQLVQHQGNIAAAEQKYQDAIKADRKFVPAHNSLAMLYTRTGRYNKAADSFQTAVKLQPKDAQLRNNLGFVYLVQGKLDDARAQFSKAVRLDDDFHRAHINLGITLAKLGKYDQSFKSFRKACSAADAHYNLACMYQIAGKTKLARKHYKKALRVQPQFVAAQKALKAIDSP